jgi:AcrR family transcriptional regulator
MSRPYHHGSLRQAVVDAAVAEVVAVGAARLSMREIARRAGVSHAAPAHHFGDKAGIFTAIAIDGFRMITEMIAPIATGSGGFLRGGIAYVMFALQHPGHFEVMFRPDLYRKDDPELVAARDAAFRVLYESARAALGGVSDEEALGMVVAGLSMSHGFATLWLTANLQEMIGADPAAFLARLTDGVVELGKVTRRQQRYLLLRDS